MAEWLSILKVILPLSERFVEKFAPQSRVVAEWWWPSVFELFGLLGVVWCVLFALLATSTPRQHRHVSAAEVQLIRSQKKTSGGKAAEEGELESREASTQALQPGDSSRSSSGGGGDGSWPSSGSSNDSSTSFQIL